MKAIYMSRRTFTDLWAAANGILADPPDLHYATWISPGTDDTSPGGTIECLWDDRMPRGEMRIEDVTP